MIRKQYHSPVRRLSNEHSEANSRPDNRKVVDAICCDCDGTLYDHNGTDHQLVAYLNARHTAGEMVVIFSSNWSQVFDRVKDIGLHPAIFRTLKDKRDCYGLHISEYIDDAPSNQITADFIFNPKAPSFRRHMQSYMDSLSSSPAAPHPSF